MSDMNVTWAIAELDKFIDRTVMHNDSRVGRGYVSISNKSSTAAPDAEVTKQAQVVEKILDRVVSGWRTNIDLSQINRWTRHREAAIRAREELLRADEVRANLGDGAPEISAGNLHPWVWTAAKPLWDSGHHRSAVEDAAKKVNSETQNKVDRRDVSETDLFQQAFTIDAPVDGKPRLRRIAPDGSETYKSMQRGASALAEGLYAGIRNPLAHEGPQDLSEQVALEYLAALSVLARWVDDSLVEES